MTPGKSQGRTDSNAVRTTVANAVRTTVADTVRTTVADTVVGHYGVDFTLVFALGSFVSRASVTAAPVTASVVIGHIKGRATGSQPATVNAEFASL